MKKRDEQFYNDPWDRDFYETGSTEPPKSRGGTLAVALIAVILLVNTFRALGLMNFNLLWAMGKTENSQNLSLFGSTEPTAGETTPAVTFSGPATLELCDAVPGALSEGADLERAARSQVTVRCGGEQGSGVVMTVNGYILTAAHTLDSGSVTVTFPGGMELPATVVGSSYDADIAVLYVQASGLTAAEFANSSQLSAGAEAMLLGMDAQEGGIFTFDAEQQTFLPAPDAAAEGFLLVNSAGQVLGLRTANGAVPTAQLKTVVDGILAASFTPRPALELEGHTVSDFDRRYYSIPRGVLVTGVADGGCADDAGIRAGDVITELAGQSVGTSEELAAVLSGFAPGDSVSATVYRQQTRQIMKFTVILSEEEAQ